LEPSIDAVIARVSIINVSFGIECSHFVVRFMCCPVCCIQISHPILLARPEQSVQ